MGASAVTERIRAIGYVRVSTREQAESGAGLQAQRDAITAAAAQRGWQVVGIRDDQGASAKSLSGRPGVLAAIEAVEHGGADVLVVAKLDRLSRSVADFAAILDRARRRNWGLVALDIGVDTTTPAGELVANVMAAVAQWERRAIGERTRDGLAAKRAAGVRLGRPPVLSPVVVERIATARRAGCTLQAIADSLNDEAIPTAHGGACWRPSTVAGVLSRCAPTTNNDTA